MSKCLFQPPFAPDLRQLTGIRATDAWYLVGFGRITNTLAAMVFALRINDVASKTGHDMLTESFHLPSSRKAVPLQETLCGTNGYQCGACVRREEVQWPWHFV